VYTAHPREQFCGGQESAGKPSLSCIAFTAILLCRPSTPSTLPTL
jgi:hypothetical protein